MTLSLLLTETAALLNDSTFSFTSKTQLTRWINQARRQVAMRTGCIRRLVTGQSSFGGSFQPGIAIPGAAQASSAPDPSNVPFTVTPSYALAPASCQTIPGVERYPYIGFFNPILKQQHAGISGVLDAIALSVNWGGVSRPSLDWMTWDDFQAWCRAYAVLNAAFPSVWSVMNDGPNGEIYLFPAPSQAGDMELDCFCLPSDLNSDDDYDAIPSGFHDAIQFKAAELAFQGTERYAQAQVMESAFMDRMGVARVGSDRGKTRSYYG
jgi:hypothetical protein